MTVIPGQWFVTIVDVDDGIVIVEAPISSEYCELVISEAARRHPGRPIRAVVTTSDAWPQIACLRAYVARGIPVYGLDLNRPIIERLLRTPHLSKPDFYQRAPRPLRYVGITERTTVGSGGNASRAADRRNDRDRVRVRFRI